MRIAYLDCFSGMAGDMFLGAMLDAGLDLKALRSELAKLPLEGYSLDSKRVVRAGLAATKALVEIAPDPPPRLVSDVLRVIEESTLPGPDRDRGLRVFRWLAEAEADVHGADDPLAVHLHELGAVDAIIDVMSAVIGLRLLKIEELYCSPLPAGDGEVNTQHGVIPIPGPATLKMLARARAPLRAGGSTPGEWVTPTGAAIVTALGRFGRPEMTIERVGYGAGSSDPPGRPNVVRLWIGERTTDGARHLALIETNIDDMTPEALAYVQEKLMAAGAADAWFTPVQMKKGRPAVMLSVLCREPQEEALARLLLRETSTLGVRVRTVRRWEAEREVLEFESSLGPAAVKVKRLPGEPPRFAPEFEACRRLAESSGLPLAEVYRIVEEEARTQAK